MTFGQEMDLVFSSNPVSNMGPRLQSLYREKALKEKILL